MIVFDSPLAAIIAAEVKRIEGRLFDELPEFLREFVNAQGVPPRWIQEAYEHMNNDEPRMRALLLRLELAFDRITSSLEGVGDEHGRTRSTIFEDLVSREREEHSLRSLEDSLLRAITSGGEECIPDDTPRPSLGVQRTDGSPSHLQLYSPQFWSIFTTDST